MQVTDFEHINMRRVYGSKRDRKLRRLHREELYNLYHSSNIVRVIKRRRLRWSCQNGRSVSKIVISKLTRERPLGRRRRRWEDINRMDLEEIGINAGNWVDSAEDRNYWKALVNAALNLWIP